MANEIRLRRNNIAGTITDNPLTDGATTINSVGFQDLPVVDGSNHLILILDPLEIAGPAEIVRVTAHTAAATSVTVTRGQEGSAVRSHVFGTTWFHGPVVTDWTESVAADNEITVPYRGQAIFNRIENAFKVWGNNDVWVQVCDLGQWDTWTPTLSNLTLGNGTVVARFTRFGRTVHWMFQFTLGSTSAVGTTPGITPPVTMSGNYGVSRDPVGEVLMLDSGTATFWGKVLATSSTTLVFVAQGAAASIINTASITASVPFTWTTNDVLSASGTYEAAASA